MSAHEKICIVTGGGSGIGRGICRKFASQGITVVIADINLAAAEETARIISQESSVLTLAVETDVTSLESVGSMVAAAVAKFSHIDILVNNAGTDIKGTIAGYDPETWDKLMALNLKGVFLTTKAVIPHMIENGSGRIVNISSIAGKTGESFTSPYCASKFGVIGFTQSAALELGKYNITVNAVCPGPVETNLIKSSVTETAKLNNRSYEEELNSKFLSHIPLGRLAQPSDVANAVNFLASDEASYITGIALTVSGGMELH